MKAFEELANILGSDKDTIRVAVEKLEEVTGEKDILKDITGEISGFAAERIGMLGVSATNSDEIFQALLARATSDEEKIIQFLGSPMCDTEEGCSSLINAAIEVADVGKGFFLKKDKAVEFLRREPPQNTLALFGLKGVDELLHRFGLFEVYSALRFMEDKEWLNNVFFKQLEHVTPDDFEERSIEVHVLQKEWIVAAESFLKKKLHNVSHLKELGTIFILPLGQSGPGMTLRLLTLVFHYLHEVRFYSTLFSEFSRAHEVDFARYLVSALRGDVPDMRLEEEVRGWKWMIVQRYLAKEDLHDWRLSEPHVNPEAIHWSKAEADIVKLGKRIEGVDFEFWHHLSHVGIYVPDSSGVQVLVSFNLIDTIMSLVEKTRKYTYHQQEALWNQLFSLYFSEEQLEQLILRHINTGYINIKTLALNQSQTQT